MFSFSGGYRRTGAILVAAAIAGGVAFLYFANRLPPIPQGTLRIGFEQNPPMQYRTADGLAGVGVEALNEAAKRSGLRIQWVETGVSSAESFRKGLVDLWPVMADLPDRRKFIHFSRPWLHSGHALLLRSGSQAPDREFTGRIGLFRLPLHVRMAKSQFPSAELVQFPVATEILRELCKGTVAAGFMEFRTALGTLQAKPAECAAVTIRTQLLSELTNQLAVASTFAAAGAADRLRGEIGNMFRDGTMAVMMAKYPYFSLDATWAAFDSLEAAERARWVAMGVSGLTFLLAVVIWRVFSARQRRRTAAALRESEERFRNMADTAPVMIWVAGPDKRFTFFNKTWLEFTGRSLEQELGDGWTSGVHPEDLGRCYETFRAASEERRSFHVECRLRRADGEYRSILCSGVPRFDSAGAFVGYIGSDIDITDLQSEERFRQLAENIGQVFWMVDLAANKVVYISPAFEKVWGQSTSELYRDRAWLKQTVHPEDRADFEAVYDKAGSGSIEATYRIIRPDGAVRWIHDRAFTVRNREGEPYRVAGIAEDITEQREIEEQLSQTNKMEAIGNLAGGVAHDFNNLLTVICGYSHMLLEITEGPSRDKLEQILNAANQASVLTKQLLAFSRRQVMQPKPVHLNHLVTNLKAMLGRIIGEQITIETALDPELGLIRADPHQLEQVVMNLAVNARDAMPEGGLFRIETRTVGAARLTNGASAVKSGKRVRLTLSDTGCGMEERVLERAFEPFFTTKGIGKGTGLGLSTVYGIVRQNEGTIHVSSRLGEGTVFELDFPLAAEEETADAAPAIAEVKPEAAGTILLAEDEPAVRGLVRESLLQLGYNVLEAGDGYEALKLVEEHDTEIRLLLTDVIMPLMNGQQLAERLRAIRPGIKVIYMSGYTDDVLAFHGIEPEIDFIQKPFTYSDLAGKLEKALAKSKGASG